MVLSLLEPLVSFELKMPAVVEQQDVDLMAVDLFEEESVREFPTDSSLGFVNVDLELFVAVPVSIVAAADEA